MFITKKKALKIAGLELAVLIALLVVQIGMQFASSYRWVGFQKKDQSSWISIAEIAQANYGNCSEELEQAKKDKATAIFSNNPDLQ